MSSNTREGRERDTAVHARRSREARGCGGARPASGVHRRSSQMTQRCWDVMAGQDATPRLARTGGGVASGSCCRMEREGFAEARFRRHLWHPRSGVGAGQPVVHVPGPEHRRAPEHCERLRSCAPNSWQGCGGRGFGVNADAFQDRNAPANPASWHDAFRASARCLQYQCPLIYDLRSTLRWATAQGPAHHTPASARAGHTPRRGS